MEWSESTKKPQDEVYLEAVQRIKTTYTIGCLNLVDPVYIGTTIRFYHQ